jgi:hypothetical protein
MPPSIHPSLLTLNPNPHLRRLPQPIHNRSRNVIFSLSFPLPFSSLSWGHGARIINALDKNSFHAALIEVPERGEQPASYGRGAGAEVDVVDV